MHVNKKAVANGNLSELGYSQYDVSESGKITNVVTGKTLKPFIDRRGYENYSLWGDDGHRKTLRGHRLVAEKFVPNPHDLQQVDHVDGNKLNNHISNLQWVSNLENAHRAMENGLWPHVKINKEVATAACELLELGYTVNSVSKDLNVPRTTIAEIKCRRAWKELSKDYDF